MGYLKEFFLCFKNEMIKYLEIVNKVLSMTILLPMNMIYIFCSNINYFSQIPDSIPGTEDNKTE